MKKEKVNSEELGKSLFDFAIMSCQTFLKSLDKAENKDQQSLNKEDINQGELLIAYLWLVFHFLNVAGTNYEDTAKHMHNTYVSFLKLPQQEIDLAMKHLADRYEEYKENFSNNADGGFKNVKENSNFEKISYLIANNILGKININVFFSFSLGVHMQQTAIALGNLLKEIDLKE
ncbi:MAG: hypothetical protein PHX76_03055 [Patescibacteria group bacterium]|nr:hypothetical protein [Patescibacteria group bacterium]MDD3940240.1 hypothetical protein [Candidatus Paceibacterota bacterium]